MRTRLKFRNSIVFFSSFVLAIFVCQYYLLNFWKSNFVTYITYYSHRWGFTWFYIYLYMIFLIFLSKAWSQKAKILDVCCEASRSGPLPLYRSIYYFNYCISINIVVFSLYCSISYKHIIFIGLLHRYCTVAVVIIVLSYYFNTQYNTTYCHTFDLWLSNRYLIVIEI